MNFLHDEFEAQAGDVIEVTIDRAANVQLLDQRNYDDYRAGRPFRYRGGYATTSPVRLVVPGDGLWHVVIDFGGGAGQVESISRLISGVAV